MSPRRDVFVAISCYCLALSLMGIQAKSVPKTAVTKRDSSDWVSYFYDLLDDSDSEEGSETILTCCTCTGLAETLPAGAAAPGSTTNNVVPGATPSGDSAAVFPAAPNPVPPASANPAPAAPSVAQSPATEAPPAPQGPLPAVPPGASSPSPTATAVTAAVPPSASSTVPAG